MIIANHLTDKINQKCGQKSKITSYQRRDGSLPDLENYLNENPEKKENHQKMVFKLFLHNLCIWNSKRDIVIESIHWWLSLWCSLLWRWTR